MYQYEDCGPHGCAHCHGPLDKNAYGDKVCRNPQCFLYDNGGWEIPSTFLIIHEDGTVVETTGRELYEANPEDDDIRTFAETAFMGQMQTFGGGATPIVRIARLTTDSKGNVVR